MGPLDKKSLAEIRKSGFLKDPGKHVLDELDRQTRERIVDKLLPACRRKSLVDSIYLSDPGHRHAGSAPPSLLRPRGAGRRSSDVSRRRRPRHTATLDTAAPATLSFYADRAVATRR